MRNLWQTMLAVVAVLVAVVAIGASINKPAPVSAAHYETATLARGCFWGLQETLRQIPGVIKTEVGYTGGTTPNPTYEMVLSGGTGHTEAVEVIFDPAKVSFEGLVADFLASRKPLLQSTNTDARHRPAVFYHDEGQRQAAERVVETINNSRKWNVPVVAEINPATKFYRAEEYHQDYYQKIASTHVCSLE